MTDDTLVTVTLTAKQWRVLTTAACHPHTGWWEDDPVIGPAVREIMNQVGRTDG